DVRVVNVSALVPDDSAKLLVGIVIDERRVDEDERLFLGAKRASIQRRLVDDVDLRDVDAELLAALLRQGLDARELSLGDANGMAEELSPPDLLPHPDRARDGELDRSRILDRVPDLSIEHE